MLQNDWVEKEETRGRGTAGARIRYYTVQPGLLKTAVTGVFQ